MDSEVADITRLFQKFKAAYEKDDYDTGDSILSQLKLKLTGLPGLPPLFKSSPTVVQELFVAKLLPLVDHNHTCLKHAVELEQSFMEGAYNRVLSARQDVPHEKVYVYFMDLLGKTVRDEIAGCSEKASDSLSMADAKKILMFSSDQELQDHSGWEICGTRVYLQKAKELVPCKVIPSIQLINQTLGYARELERIV